MASIRSAIFRPKNSSQSKLEPFSPSKMTSRCWSYAGLLAASAMSSLAWKDLPEPEFPWNHRNMPGDTAFPGVPETWMSMMSDPRLKFGSGSETADASRDSIASSSCCIAFFAILFSHIGTKNNPAFAGLKVRLRRTIPNRHRTEHRPLPFPRLRQPQHRLQVH